MAGCDPPASRAVPMPLPHLTYVKILSSLYDEGWWLVRLLETPVAPLTDPTLLGHFRDALREWRCDGFVVWKRNAAEGLRLLLGAHTQKSIAKLLYEHVEAGGVIDQIRERRSEYASRHEHHFDFRLNVDGRLVYIETTLDLTPTGPVVTIVSLHDV